MTEQRLLPCMTAKKVVPSHGDAAPGKAGRGRVGLEFILGRDLARCQGNNQHMWRVECSVH